MANILYMTGKAKWCKLYQPDDFNGLKKWKMSFFPDPQSWDRYEKAGLKLKRRFDEDGEYIILSRDTEKVMKGNVVEFEPPEVVDADEREFVEPIGNGSEVTVAVATFDTKFGKGHRLNKVRVDTHVPFDGDTPQRMPARGELGSYQQGEEKLIDQQPSLKPAKSRKKVVEMIDDEIPF
jgi:hypothetical protein